MDYTQMLGDTNELKCITKFTEMGYYCSIPYGNSAKYDFIVDIGGELLRMQCKSSSYVNGEKKCFRISTVTTTTNTKKTTRRTYTSKDIDYFCTYFEGNVYVIPVAECSKAKFLYLKERKMHNQNLACDYLVDKIFKKSESIERSEILYRNRCNAKNVKNLSVFNVCKVCGEKISEDADMCVQCSHMCSRVVVRPLRDVLKEEIRVYSFKSLGKKYGVCDRTISKWCKSYKLPHLKHDINKYTDEDWMNI